MIHRPALGLAELERLFDEDALYGDLTTHALGIGGRAARMTLRARGDMCVCGTEDAERLLRHLGLDATRDCDSGRTVRAGTVLMRCEGDAASLFAAWKVVQTLLEWLSGIATETRAIVDAARGGATDVAVACTRKNLPSTRRLAAYAVIAGGGAMHRLGLAETVLIFPEHRRFLDDGDTLADAILRCRRVAPERGIVVEVTDEADAVAAIEAGADVLQLEKFTPVAVARVRTVVDGGSGRRPRVAAAGGIHAGNAADYAAAGAEILVTSRPYAAAPRDVAVELRPA
ncbi:MAG: ModD protein [Nevskiales bacterium]|nr:ModD protein [Nevskiales bacterium]